MIVDQPVPLRFVAMVTAQNLRNYTNSLDEAARVEFTKDHVVSFNSGTATGAAMALWHLSAHLSPILLQRAMEQALDTATGSQDQERTE